VAVLAEGVSGFPGVFWLPGVDSLLLVPNLFSTLTTSLNLLV
jgi:hypothetical protein